MLPFLVARALVPVGFMARVSDGQLSVVFCSVGTVGLQASDHRSSHSDTSSDRSTDAAGDNQDDGTQTDFSCPFSQVAAAPLLDVGGSEAIPFISSAEVLAPAESPYYAAGPPRRITNRGPPAHA